MEINQFTLLGIVSWIGGLGIVIFQAISQAMNTDNQWTALFLEGIVGDSLDGVAEKIPLEILQTGFNYIMYELPFYQLLLFLGVIFVVLGMFFKR